ncbi:pro-sigmaK processing inhibitor BofA family protein [Clostridium vincentii]|uniref:Sigma-K factor-processing regulatory protein BofA n=1 Tax=Clostridium vincentii TaxID=52704 RepID=A0A2T0BA21_9CLOT|nr:pro-sigmaK processing inhibitor BofA family protein [Clostridium vincentii]PRR80751.1 Sigma-K factor-processing regulatory protein BofA [Clostridium vincentii]
MELLQSADSKLVIYGIVAVIVLFIILKIFKWPLKILLNGIFGVVLLYIVNLVGANFGFSIGINVVTALIAGILGIPGVAALIIFKLFI